MHSMNHTENDTQVRQAALAGLATVGFIALVSLGVWLAVYVSQYVPFAVGRIGAAAVSLSQVFTQGNGNANLSVVPNATSTLPIQTASSTAASTTPTASSTPVAVKPAPTAGKETSTTTPVQGTKPAPLYGFADLSVVIVSTGYMSGSAADTYVASSSVPTGYHPAVRFIIKNIGTNLSGSWRFSASLPTSVNALYESQPQQSLGPNDYIEYTLGFDQPNRGEQTITITANYDKGITESNTNNDKASAKIVVLGA